MQGLSSEIKFSNYPRFFGVFLLLTSLVFVFSKVNNTAALGGFIVLMIAAGYFRPRWFIYLSAQFLLTRYIFIFRPIFEYSVEKGSVTASFGPGRLLLNFLQIADPGSTIPVNLPRALFLALLAVIFLRVLANRDNIFKADKKLRYFYLFMVFVIASAISNFAFDKSALNFVISLTLPVMIFYFVKDTPFSQKQRALLVGYLMFVCFEMQIVFSTVNNFDKLMGGEFFYGDNAIGTFIHPFSEYSGYLLAIAFLFFFYEFLIHRKVLSIVKALIAFYGILSISSVLFLVSLVAFSGFSLVYALKINVMTAKTFALSVFAMLLLALPIGYLVSNPEIYYDGVHAQKHLEESSKKEFYEIPKIYTFINLVNMMDEENKYIFGSGPGTFLSKGGAGPLFDKYNSFAVLKANHLSSSQRLENSFVGIVGEIGLFGWIFYVAFFYHLMQLIIKAQNDLHRREKRFEVLYISMILSLLFFFGVSFIRNLLETIEMSIPLMIFIGMVYQEENERIENLIQAQANKEENTEKETSKTLIQGNLPMRQRIPT